MHGLSVGNEVLKQLHAEMSLDKVEGLMDQTREGVERQRVRCHLSKKDPNCTDIVSQEVDEALASQMSPEEEDAVQAELAELEREAAVRTPRFCNQNPTELDALLSPQYPPYPRLNRSSCLQLRSKGPHLSKLLEPKVILSCQYALLADLAFAAEPRAAVKEQRVALAA
jgi:hypothetical protein